MNVETRRINAPSARLENVISVLYELVTSVVHDLQKPPSQPLMSRLLGSEERMRAEIERQQQLLRKLITHLSQIASEVVNTSHTVADIIEKKNAAIPKGLWQLIAERFDSQLKKPDRCRAFYSVFGQAMLKALDTVYNPSVQPADTQEDRTIIKIWQKFSEQAPEPIRSKAIYRLLLHVTTNATHAKNASPSAMEAHTETIRQYLNQLTDAFETQTITSADLPRSTVSVTEPLRSTISGNLLLLTDPEQKKRLSATLKKLLPDTTTQQIAGRLEMKAPKKNHSVATIIRERKPKSSLLNLGKKKRPVLRISKEDHPASAG